LHYQLVALLCSAERLQQNFAERSSVGMMDRRNDERVYGSAQAMVPRGTKFRRSIVLLRA
jgi:hypothetical protein